MTIINLTPHNIVIISDSGVNQDPKTKQYSAPTDAIEVLKVFEQSGELARVKMASVPCGELEGVPTQKVTYGVLEGLPEPKEGIYYIVSGLVASAACASNRGGKDLLTPGLQVRDAANPSVVLGCLFLNRQ
jgi:hypothetical protein